MGTVGRGARRAVLLAVAILGALLALTPGVVRAQGQAQGDQAQGDDAEKRRQAGQHVEEGDKLKEQGAYDKAAEEYQKAYDLVPHPLLLFNLAQVYRLGGEREKALDHYEKYLTEDPEGPAAEQAREFADKLRAELAAQPEQPNKPKKKKGEGGRRESSRGKWLRYGGLGAAGLGAIFVGVGIKYGLDARSAADQVSGHEGAWDKETLALEKSGPRAEKKFYLFTALGAAAIAGGGVLYWMGMRADKEADEGPVVTPTASDDGAGVSLLWQY